LKSFFTYSEFFSFDVIEHFKKFPSLFLFCIQVDKVDSTGSRSFFVSKVLGFLGDVYMLCNVAIVPTRGAFGKLLDLFLVSNPNDVGDFHQISVPWSDHEPLLLWTGVQFGLWLE
jgi:hypothetical protein